LVLLGVVVVAIAASVGAYAYFTSTGSGTGSATIGSASNWTVNQTAADTLSVGPLYPDPTVGVAGTIQTNSYHVKNNSAGNQNLANVAISVANANGSTWTLCKGVATTDGSNVSGGNCTNGSYVGKPACKASDFSVGGELVGVTHNDTTLAHDFTAGGDDTSGLVTVQMIDDSANQDNCQGASVPLYFYAS
jgi:hypothetical protein